MSSVDIRRGIAQFVLELERQKKSHNTIKNYKSDLNVFLGFLEHRNSTQLKSLGDSLAREYAVFLDDKYDSANSKRRRLQTLRALFDYLMSEGEVSFNPFTIIIPANKKLKGPHPPKFDEICRFYSSFKDQRKKTSQLSQTLILRNKVLFAMIYYTGLRVSELEKISLADFKLNKEKFYIKLPREIVIESAFLTDLTSTYLEILKNLRSLVGMPQNKTFLFSANAHSTNLELLSARGMEIIFSEHSKRTQIKITPKTLREAAIVYWIRQGLVDAKIKNRLGLSQHYQLNDYYELSERKDFIFGDLPPM